MALIVQSKGGIMAGELEVSIYHQRPGPYEPQPDSDAGLSEGSNSGEETKDPTPEPPKQESESA